MTAVVVILIVLALVFGVGAVLEGIAWALLIAVALLAVGAYLAWQKLQGTSRSA